jgi:hypothetical protein
MNVFTWDYKIPLKYNKNDVFLFQIDWNQTLMTTFNIINNNLNNKNEIINCLTPIKFQKLIESLTFYNKETSIYKNYKFEFIESNDDTIKINNNIELKILNYNE